MSQAEKDNFINGKDRIKLYYRQYTAENEKARLVIVHGLGEHSGRYRNVVEPLLSEGLSIWVIDHRGHGRSGGPRGHVRHFGDYIEDLKECVLLARRDLPEKRKLFMLGHSMGGLIALHFAIRHPDLIDNLIISSPALGVTAEVPPIKLLLGKIMSVVWPGLKFNNELDATKISHDSGVVEAYQKDPLVHDRVSARWVTEFFNAMDTANRSVKKLNVPILMQVAGDDHLTNAASSKNFFDGLSVDDKTLHVYDGLYHECYNETEGERGTVLNHLVAWVKSRI
jgi:alpha-beta hydrolase superfamily lysophospholipase